jgi:VanZ family protein
LPGGTRSGRLGDCLARWLPVVAWAALISLFSSRWFTGDRTGAVLIDILARLLPGFSPEQLRAIHHLVRELAHFVEYFVLSLLLYRALRVGYGWSARAAATAVVIAGLYAVGDELHQWFVPGRTAAATDCLIDLSGAAAAQGMIAAMLRGAQRSRSVA